MLGNRNGSTELPYMFSVKAAPNVLNWLSNPEGISPNLAFRSASLLHSSAGGSKGLLWARGTVSQMTEASIGFRAPTFCFLGYTFNGAH